MRYKKKLQQSICLVLCASMLALSACGTKNKTDEDTTTAGKAQPPSASYTDTAGTVKKSETVYVTMDSNGTPTQKIVTDWLHTDKAGVNVTDRSDLKNIKNVKSDVAPTVNGNTLNWQMETTDLYYQGTTEKALPIDVSISYFLNGAAIAPKDLAGKSGKVRIEIKLKNNEARTVTVAGEQTTMYVPIIALGGMILPETKFQNIKMENGAVIGEGNNQIAMFVSVPGLSESLKLSESGIDQLQSMKFPSTFTMTADVTEFSLGNMAFAASPSLPDIDLSGVSTPLDEVKTSLASLEDLQNAVKSLDPDRVLSSLFTGKESPLTLINQLTSMYRANEALLSVMPKYITEKNWALLRRVQTDMKALNIDKVLDALTNDLTPADLIKLQKLLNDVQALSDIDSVKLKKLLNSLSGISDMTGVLKSGSTLLLQTAGREKELGTLEKLLGSSDELMSMLESLQSLQSAMGQQGITLTDDDIKVMVGALVEKKAMEIAAEQTGMTAAQLSLLLSAKTEDIVPTNGAIPAQYRDMLVAAIHLGAKNSSLIQGMETSLVNAAKSGSMNRSQVSVTRIMINEEKAEIEKQLAQKDVMVAAITAQLSSLMKQADSVSKKLSGVSNQDLNDLMAFAKTAMPTIKELSAELGKHKGQLANLENVLNDPDMLLFLQDLSVHLSTLLTDLEVNVESLQDILDKIDPKKNPELVNLLSSLPALLKDLKDTKPILDSLNQDMENPEIKKAMDNAPQTVAAIMKIKADLDKNTALSKALSNLGSAKTGETISGIFGQLNSLESSNVLGKYSSLLTGAGGLVARAEAYFGLTRSYKIYTDAAEGMETSVFFIMKTNAIAQPEIKQETPVVEESGGLSAWFKKTFKK